jgi:hypothetical protein
LVLIEEFNLLQWVEWMWCGWEGANSGIASAGKVVCCIIEDVL